MTCFQRTLARVLLAALICLSGLATATVVVRLEIEELAPLSDLVVVGKVTKIESTWNQEQTKIYTKVWIQTEEVLKGPNQLEPVLVKTLGGEVDGVNANFVGAPSFVRGERVLLFLELRTDGEGYLTVGMYQGKYRLVSDPRTGEIQAVRPPPGVGVSAIGLSGEVNGADIRALAEVRDLFQGGAR
jgi:hypothetical protein